MVVRPWWAPVPEGSAEPSVGFAVEYGPEGHTSAELRVRPDHVGPRRRARRGDLPVGRLYDGRDVRAPELMANHLIRLVTWSPNSV